MIEALSVFFGIIAAICWAIVSHETWRQAKKKQRFEMALRRARAMGCPTVTEFLANREKYK